MAIVQLNGQLVQVPPQFGGSAQVDRKGSTLLYT
jgi:hypothetical protein